MDILQILSRTTATTAIGLLTLGLPVFASAEWHATGFVGALSRIQTGSINLSDFRSGPVSTTTPVFGAEVGRAIWRIHLDATLLSSPTGQAVTVIGLGRQITQTANGHSLLFDGGAAWPFWRLAGFQTFGRVGYGTARVRVPTEIPIEDDQRYWTYGVFATRNVGSHYLLRLGARNIHFRRDEIPETLGRFNAIVLAGFGLRF